METIDFNTLPGRTQVVFDREMEARTALGIALLKYSEGVRDAEELGVHFALARRARYRTLGALATNHLEPPVIAFRAMKLLMSEEDFPYGSVSELTWDGLTLLRHRLSIKYGKFPRGVGISFFMLKRALDPGRSWSLDGPVHEWTKTQTKARLGQAPSGFGIVLKGYGFSDEEYLAAILDRPWVADLPPRKKFQ